MKPRIVFYKEQSSIVVQVVELNDTYKIISVIPTRNPSRIETEYVYNDIFDKGTLWDVDKLMMHGFLEYAGQIQKFKGESEIDG